MQFARLLLLVVVMLGTISVSLRADDTPYTQHQNIVYGEAHGIGLIMDIFVPKENKNGLAVVDVISGAWHSDRGKIRDHMRSQTFDIFCRKGYTVFAIRPGSITKFSGPEMRSNLNTGIRWVKDHATEYGIDPNRMGMMGASAGGHLASLAAVTAEDEKSTDGKIVPSTRVKAVAVFFPPTDFLQYGEKKVDLKGDERIAKSARRLAFPEAPADISEEDAIKALTAISPARLVTPKAPPFLIIHGDADLVVPLQQSQVLLEGLKKSEVPAELIVKAGGGHPWLTIHEEMKLLADWFDKQL